MNGRGKKQEDGVDPRERCRLPRFERSSVRCAPAIVTIRSSGTSGHVDLLEKV
jgi:hypothetical protein